MRSALQCLKYLAGFTKRRTAAHERDVEGVSRQIVEILGRAKIVCQVQCYAIGGGRHIVTLNLRTPANLSLRVAQMIEQVISETLQMNLGGVFWRLAGDVRAASTRAKASSAEELDFLQAKRYEDNRAIDVDDIPHEEFVRHMASVKHAEA